MKDSAFSNSGVYVVRVLPWPGVAVNSAIRSIRRMIRSRLTSIFHSHRGRRVAAFAQSQLMVIAIVRKTHDKRNSMPMSGAMYRTQRS